LHSGNDIRRQPLIERKRALQWVLRKSRNGIQYVEHAKGHGDKLYKPVCDLGLEGIVSKRLTSVYRSGPSKTWIKVKNPKSPAATRLLMACSEYSPLSVLRRNSDRGEFILARAAKTKHANTNKKTMAANATALCARVISISTA
jgi:hypothetical protein